MGNEYLSTDEDTPHNSFFFGYMYGVAVVFDLIQFCCHYQLMACSTIIFKVHTWSMDANQFVADEDDATYDSRVSGESSTGM